MCNQVIISTELDDGSKTTISTIKISATKLRLAVALVAKALLPTVIGVYYAYLRNQKFVVENVRRQIWPAVIAFVANSVSRSLSSVQRSFSYSLAFRQIKDVSLDTNEEDLEPEKCVECDVLYEPQDGAIKADVVFIHGIHGSLHKTWKQGVWRHEKHHLNQRNLAKCKSADDVRKHIEHINLKRSVSNGGYSTPNKVARKNDQNSVESNFTEELEEDSSEQTEDSYSPCWPKEWLPKDCPDVRVIAINYTTDPHLWRPLWVKKRIRTSLTERSKEMIKLLNDIGVGKKPIIWVGHSKGGLYVKQIIVHCWENWNLPGLGDMYAQTKAILFYSVPHRGSILADFNLPLLRKSVELMEVQRNCPFVLQLHDKFLKILQDECFKPEIFSFIETSFTLMSFVYLKIVAFQSANPGVGNICGVPLDHREICKPAGRDCFLYKELINLINNVLYPDSMLT